MTEETDLKSAVKQYLDLKGIFSYHVLQGLGAYKGLPDRVIHYKEKVEDWKNNSMVLYCSLSNSR